MSDHLRRDVFEQALAFFGRMTALLSHEMKNALSVLNELGGLLGDLSLSAQRGRPIPAAQLDKIANGIQKQVQRCDAYIKRLHHFSHNTDSFRALVPLDAAVAEIVQLSQILAARKKVTLDVESHAPPQATVVDKVFFWQMAVYECICAALDNAQEGDTIAVRFANHPGPPFVRITGSRGIPETALEPYLPILSVLVGELNATLEQISGGEGKSAAALVIRSATA